MSASRRARCARRRGSPSPRPARWPSASARPRRSLASSTASSCGHSTTATQAGLSGSRSPRRGSRSRPRCIWPSTGSGNSHLREHVCFRVHDGRQLHRRQPAGRADPGRARGARLLDDARCAAGTGASLPREQRGVLRSSATRRGGATFIATGAWPARPSRSMESDLRSSASCLQPTSYFSVVRSDVCV